MIYRLFTFVAFIALVGCASGPVKLPVANLAASEKTHVEDLRPATEGTRDTFSLLITSDRYGYTRLAQDITDPSGPRLFSHLLQEKYDTVAVPPTKLHHFIVYANNRSVMKRGALGAVFGPIGALVAVDTVAQEGGAINAVVDPARFAAESGEDEYKRAIYADPQIPEDTSTFVIYIESESQQKRHFTRTIWPIKPSKEGEKIPLYQAMEAAIQFNLRQ